MKQNLVGKILGKIKIFGQDFVTIVTGISLIYFLFFFTAREKIGGPFILALYTKKEALSQYS